MSAIDGTIPHVARVDGNRRSDSVLRTTGIHVLRHTAKLRRDAGESIEAASAFLDHSSLAVTTVYLRRPRGRRGPGVGGCGRGDRAVSHATDAVRGGILRHRAIGRRALGGAFRHHSLEIVAAGVDIPPNPRAPYQRRPHHLRLKKEDAMRRVLIAVGAAALAIGVFAGPTLAVSSNANGNACFGQARAAYATTAAPGSVGAAASSRKGDNSTINDAFKDACQP